MRLTANELAREAAATGFQTEPLEKVILLLELLEAIRSHPFLKERVVLKGGTALNVFRFDVPRLSVDIDLNYIGAVDRDGMLADRPKIEQALHAVCGRVGVQPRRVPSDHAGGKWRLNFNRVAGGTSTLEMDVNFLLRTPLWPVERIDSRPVGTFQATDVPVLDIHELAAGKLAALLSRTASRDLFDASQLLRGGGLDAAKLRLAFVVYGGTSRKDWRTVSVDECHCRRRRGRRDADSAAPGKGHATPQRPGAVDEDAHRRLPRAVVDGSAARRSGAGVSRAVERQGRNPAGRAD